MNILEYENYHEDKTHVELTFPYNTYLCSIPLDFSGVPLHWHDDMNDRARKLAIVINLSGRPFQGGQFQLRRKGADGLLLAFDHVEPGSALLFAVRPELEHRVLPVTGTNPRRVYAGWFLDRPESGGLSLAPAIGRTY